MLFSSTKRWDICKRLWICYGYGQKSFARNMVKNIRKSRKYNQKLLDPAKKFATDAIELLQKERFKKQQKQLVI